MTVHYCDDCKGTGAKNAKKNSDGSYIRCWTCNGNGLDPAAYFRWSGDVDTTDSAYYDTTSDQ